MRRELLFASRDDALFMNNKGYIFIVRRLGKQSKLVLSRLDSISNLKLKIHGQCGPDAHAEADLQAFLIFCFRPILISAHKLTLLIYGDNRIAPTAGLGGFLGLNIVSTHPTSRRCAPHRSMWYMYVNHQHWHHINPDWHELLQWTNNSSTMMCFSQRLRSGCCKLKII